MSMNFWTKAANWLAKYSVEHWNRCRPLRLICRAIYRAMNRVYCSCSSKYRSAVQAYLNGEVWHRLYPWPYCAEAFPGFEEADDALITDQCRFVIKRSTSYCTIMIRIVTGRWPRPRRRKRHTGESWLHYAKTGFGRSRERYDAKRWQEYLALCGFNEVVTEVEQGHFYIGIDPNYGEFGQLYWLVPDLTGIMPAIVSSTYENFKYKVTALHEQDLRQLLVIKIC